MSFRFQSRVVLSGVLSVKPGARLLFAGAGLKPQADLSLVPDALGSPYIPGSTVKRLMRKHAQQCLVFLTGSESTCNPSESGRACINLGQPRMDGRTYLKELLDEHIWSDDQLKDAIEKHTCVLCSVFGSALVEPRLSVSDLVQESWHTALSQKAPPSRKDPPRTDIRRFSFYACLEDSDLWQRGLVIASLQRLQSRLLTIDDRFERKRVLGGFELLRLQALESPREYLETLNERADQEGHPVDPATAQAWVQAFYARLRESLATNQAV